MANSILITLIVVLFVLAIRSLVSKGACNDCSCDQSIKQEIFINKLQNLN